MPTCKRTVGWVSACKKGMQPVAPCAVTHESDCFWTFEGTAKAAHNTHACTQHLCCVCGMKRPLGYRSHARSVVVCQAAQATINPPCSGLCETASGTTAGILALAAGAPGWRLGATTSMWPSKSHSGKSVQLVCEKTLQQVCLNSSTIHFQVWHTRVRISSAVASCLTCSQVFTLCSYNKSAVGVVVVLGSSTPQMCAGHWHTHVCCTQGWPRTDNAAVCCCHSQPAWRILLLHEGSIRAAAAYTKLGAHQTPRCFGHTGQQLTGAEKQRRPHEPSPTDTAYTTAQGTTHETTLPGAHVVHHWVCVVPPACQGHSPTQTAVQQMAEYVCC